MEDHQWITKNLNLVLELSSQKIKFPKLVLKSRKKEAFNRDKEQGGYINRATIVLALSKYIFLGAFKKWSGSPCYHLISGWEPLGQNMIKSKTQSVKINFLSDNDLDSFFNDQEKKFVDKFFGRLQFLAISNFDFEKSLILRHFVENKLN